MHFSDNSSQYQALDSSDDGRDSSCEQTTSGKREKLSRLALLAIIIIIQALILASTNAATYALGKMRAEKSVGMTTNVNNITLGDSTSTYTNCDSNTTSPDQKQYVLNQHYWSLTARMPSDLLRRQMQHGRQSFHRMEASSRTATSRQLARVSQSTTSFIA
jgi:hypothetical protein